MMAHANSFLTFQLFGFWHVVKSFGGLLITSSGVVSDACHTQKYLL